MASGTAANEDIATLRLHQVIGRKTLSDAIQSPTTAAAGLRPRHYRAQMFPLVLPSRRHSRQRVLSAAGSACREMLKPVF